MSAQTVELKDQFFDELDSSTDEIEQNLLRLEGSSDDARAIGELYRSLHTIKGNAGLVGETAVQNLCHALESMLDKDHRERVSQELIQTALEVIDLLKAISAAGESEPFADRLAELASLVVREHESSHGVGESTDGTHAVPWLELDEWKRLVRAFHDLEKVKLATFEERPSKRRLQRLGVATVEYHESLPSRYHNAKATAGYIEQLVLAMTQIEGAAISPLQAMLEQMLEDIREYLSNLFRENNFSVTVKVERPSYLAALLTELRRRETAPILLLKLEMEYDELARDPKSYEVITELVGLKNHHVAFLVPWSSTVDKAASLLADAIGSRPVIQSSEWDALVELSQ
ncbi:MAG: Hpt domain-containing protein [Spirochaetales bacterium]